MCSKSFDGLRECVHIERKIKEKGEGETGLSRRVYNGSTHGSPTAHFTGRGVGVGQGAGCSLCVHRVACILHSSFSTLIPPLDWPGIPSRCCVPFVALPFRLPRAPPASAYPSRAPKVNVFTRRKTLTCRCRALAMCWRASPGTRRSPLGG